MADRACTRSSGRVEDRLVVSPSVQTPIRMTSFFLLIVVALLLFISTNVDDIFVLVGFFADRRYRSQDIVVGQFVEIGILFATSVAAALLSIAIRNLTLAFSGLFRSSSVSEGFGISLQTLRDRRLPSSIIPAGLRGGRSHRLHSSRFRVAQIVSQSTFPHSPSDHTARLLS
jgi:hypothetical protein